MTLLIIIIILIKIIIIITITTTTIVTKMMIIIKIINFSKFVVHKYLQHDGKTQGPVTI